MGMRTLFTLLGSAEASSEHPIARAIVTQARDVLKLPLRDPLDPEAIAGRGLRCRVRMPGGGGARTVLVGIREFLVDNRVDLPSSAEERLRKLESQGKTVVFAAADAVLLGAVAVADTVKDGHVLLFGMFV